MKNLLALALSAGLTVFACDIHADALSVGADDSIHVAHHAPTPREDVFGGVLWMLLGTAIVLLVEHPTRRQPAQAQVDRNATADALALEQAQLLNNR